MAGLQGILRSWPLLRHKHAAPVLEAEKAQAVLLLADLGATTMEAGTQPSGAFCNSAALSGCRTDVARLYLALA